MLLKLFSAVALLVLAAACSAPQALAPTQAPLATQAPPALVPTPAPTAAAQAVSTVSGAIDSISGRTLTVSTNTGPKQVSLTEDARIEQEGKGTVSDLLPGLGVGVTGKPEGNTLTAVSIRIFPAAFAGVAFGLFAHTIVSSIPVSLAVACGALGMVMVISRSGCPSTAASICSAVNCRPVWRSKAVSAA